MQLNLSETNIEKLADRIIQKLDDANMTLMVHSDYPVAKEIIKEEILLLTNLEKK